MVQAHRSNWGILSQWDQRSAFGSGACDVPRGSLPVAVDRPDGLFTVLLMNDRHDIAVREKLEDLILFWGPGALDDSLS